MQDEHGDHESGNGGQFRQFAMPDGFDLALLAHEVDEITFDNRQMPLHDPWIAANVARLAADASLLPAIGGPMLMHEVTVVPHHQPGIEVRRHRIPEDGRAVWRDEGACFRCWEAGLMLEHGIDLGLPVEPLFILWVRSDDRTVVEIGLCRTCAMDLMPLAPKWKALPSGEV